MQKTKPYIAIIAILLGGVLYSSPVFADTQNIQSTNSWSLGSNSFQDSSAIQCDIGGPNQTAFPISDAGCYGTIPDATKPYTIEQLIFYIHQPWSDLQFSCNGLDDDGTPINPYTLAFMANGSIDQTSTWSVPVHCTSQLYITFASDASDVRVFAQYIPYNTSSTSSSTMTEIDWTQPYIAFSIICFFFGLIFIVWISKK